MLSYLEPHSLILTEAAIQLVCWHYIFEYFMWYMATYMTKKQWFIQGSRKPFPGVGELGEEALIQMLTPMVQHVFGGALIALGYFTNSPQLFITGAISEFAFEVLDTFKIVQQRYITKKGWYFNAPTALVGSFVIHHSGAFTVILPICMFYADNEHVQRMGYGLLSYSVISLVLNGISSSRDIYDLKERGQFLVAYFLNFVGMIYFRWFVVLTAVYGFACDQFPTMSMKLKILVVSYVVLIKLFDCMMTIVCATQLYAWLFTSKSTVRPTKITKNSLMRPTEIPIALIRCHSAPLC